MTLCAFIFLGASFLSLWVRRDPRVWGTLLGLSLLSGLVAGNMSWIGLIFIIILLLLWVFYDRKPNIALFIFIICLIFGIMAWHYSSYKQDAYKYNCYKKNRQINGDSNSGMFTFLDSLAKNNFNYLEKYVDTTDVAKILEQQRVVKEAIRTQTPR